MKKYVYTLEGKNKRFEVSVNAKSFVDADSKMESIINGEVWKYDINEQKSKLTKSEKMMAKVM